MAGRIKTIALLFTLIAACAADIEGDIDSDSAGHDAVSRSIALSQNQPVARLFGSAELTSDGSHFIEFIVEDVQNPTKRPAIFNVIAISPTGEEDIVGSFALFPSDNPGRFIVRLETQADATIDLELRLEPAGSLDGEGAFSAKIDVSIRSQESGRDSGS